MSNATRTPQQALKDAIESGAVQAWADGKTVQFNYNNNGWKLFDGTSPAFSSEEMFWRITPTPRLRPWKPEEVPHLAMIRRKSWPGFQYSTIVGIGGEFIEYTTGRGCDEVGFEGAFQHFTHSLDGGKTWLPCGVQEGGE